MLRLLHKFRFLVLLLLVLLSVLLWLGVKKALVVDNSLTVWFMEDDPALIPYHSFQERFGNDEVVILVVKDSKSLLSRKYFNAFIKLTQELEAIPEVSDVLGPGNATVAIANSLGGSMSEPLLTANTDTSQVRHVLAGRPILKRQFFSGDYKSARFLIRLRTMPDFDTRRGEILDQVQQVIAKHLPADSYHLGGVGIIFSGLNKLSQQDFGFFLGVGYVIMFLLILAIYRKPLLLVYALGTVGLATYVTLGIYGSLGYRLNLMTTLLPIIIILLGIMDVLHVLNERDLLSSAIKNKKESALAALRNVFKPCLFTTLTTMAGFLALSLSPMAILQTFGIFSALGILLSLLFTYLLGVVLLPLIPPGSPVARSVGSGMVRLLNFVMEKRQVISVLTLLLIAACAVGIFNIKSDTYTLGYFPLEHQVVKDHQSMEANWGPYMPLELLVQPKQGKQLHDKEVVQAAVAFTDAAKKLGGVGDIFGFHTLLDVGLEGQYGPRSTRMMSSQFYLNQVKKELSLNYPQLTEQFFYGPTETGRITVFGGMASAGELTAKMDSLMRLSSTTLGRVATVTPSGYQPMYAEIVQYVTSSRVNSLLLSLLLVFLLVWLFIRSLKLAALSVLPNFFPILLMLGVMGWANIHLDTATASIAAIVLGFCIDDTIHFVYHYRECRRKGILASEARIHTMQHVGPAILITSLVLFCGYGLMIFGSLKTVSLFGILTTIAIAGALYSQLFIFPLLLRKFNK